MPAPRLTNRRDLLLLMLYSPGQSGAINEPISGRTRLVKMLFVFKNEVLAEFRAGTELTPENFYKFFAWSFGPFSTEVYDDLSFFQLRDFIESTVTDEEALPEAAAEWEEWQDQSEVEEDADVYEEEAFKLTPRGLEFTKPYYDSLSSRQQKLLSMFKARFASAALRSILKYVYDKYPDFTTRSTIKDAVLKDAR